MTKHIPFMIVTVFMALPFLIGCRDRVDDGNMELPAKPHLIGSHNMIDDGNADLPADAESARVLNVEDPHAFIRAYFPDRFTEELERVSSDFAIIEEDCTVEWMRGDESLRFPCQLITVTQTAGWTQSDQHFFVRVNSQPMSLEEVISATRGICALVGIDDANLVNWFESKRYEDHVDPSCLQTGRINNIGHSIGIRDTNYDPEKPWRFLYVISIGVKKVSEKGVRNLLLTRGRCFGRYLAWEDQSEQPMAVWFIMF